MFPRIEMDADTLLRTLRAYDASVDATAVRAALANDSSHIDSDSDSDNPKSNPIRTWVARHAAPDMLLSIDELNQ